MCGDDELYVGEGACEALGDLALPLWMQMEVDLVDEHYALAFEGVGVRVCQ